MTSGKKKKDIGWKIGLGSAFVLLALAGVIMIMMGHTPTDYMPSDASVSGRVSPYLTHELGPEFFNAVQLGEPFTLTIEQRYANEILVCVGGELELEEMTLSSPMIAFYPGTVVFMVTAQIKGVSSVLSIKAMPAVDEKGQLRPNICSVTLGALPVTEMVRGIAKKYAKEYLPSETNDETAAIIRGILDNKPVEPVVTIANEYRVRLKEIKIEAGKISLRIEPKEIKGK